MSEVEGGTAWIGETDPYAGYGRNEPIYRLNFPGRDSYIYDSLNDAMTAAEDPESVQPLRLSD